MYIKRDDLTGIGDLGDRVLYRLNIEHVGHGILDDVICTSDLQCGIDGGVGLHDTVHNDLRRFVGGTDRRIDVGQGGLVDEQCSVDCEDDVLLQLDIHLVGVKGDSCGNHEALVDSHRLPGQFDGVSFLRVGEGVSDSTVGPVLLPVNRHIALDGSDRLQSGFHICDVEDSIHNGGLVPKDRSLLEGDLGILSDGHLCTCVKLDGDSRGDCNILGNLGGPEHLNLLRTICDSGSEGGVDILLRSSGGCGNIIGCGIDLPIDDIDLFDEGNLSLDSNGTGHITVLTLDHNLASLGACNSSCDLQLSNLLGVRDICSHIDLDSLVQNEVARDNIVSDQSDIDRGNVSIFHCGG